MNENLEVHGYFVVELKMVRLLEETTALKSNNDNSAVVVAFASNNNIKQYQYIALVGF